jgi:hypothetical protein
MISGAKAGRGLRHVAAPMPSTRVAAVIFLISCGLYQAVSTGWVWALLGRAWALAGRRLMVLARKINGLGQSIPRDLAGQTSTKESNYAFK